MEAAPLDIVGGPLSWCDKTTITIPGASGWEANAVGRGQENTAAMLLECSSSAANAADDYSTLTKSDWFLPSEGELMLMYSNMRQAGVGGFDGSSYYWSSTQHSNTQAYYLYLANGTQGPSNKGNLSLIRAVRAF